MIRLMAIVPLVLLVIVAMTADFSARAASGGFLLVANKGDQTLGIIDPESGRQVAAVAEAELQGTK